MDRTDITAYLVEHGARIDAEDENGETPLSWAYSNDRQENVRLLVGIYIRRDMVDVTFRDGSTLLHFAADGGDMDQIKYLIEEKGMSARITDEDGETPLFRAAAMGHLEAVVYLLEEAGSSPLDVNRLGQAPIHRAARQGHLDIINYFIKRNVPVNLTDNGGCTPLHYAAASGEPDLVRYLLKVGADARIKDSDGETPCDWTSEDEIRELLGCSW